MNFINNKVLQTQYNILASRQVEIAKIRMLFQCYNSDVTFQQTKELMDTIEQRGYDSDVLYHIFSSGKIPNWLDKIIEELEVNW